MSENRKINKNEIEFNKLIEKVNSGEKIVVEFTRQGWEEGYLDQGMRAVITSVEDTDEYENNGEIELITGLLFDFEEYEDFNREQEKKYERDDGSFKTDSEANTISAGNKETIYFSRSEELPFKILKSDASSLFKRYKKSNKNLSYIDWLELEVRKSEKRV